ncbi:RluA family pseudouridine synthase [Merdimonas faecis]|uniref:Pseudouridine synthase n=1 Tax=Merdimonas faecis TaxID=1653435 RepID=A0A9D2VZD9_9FIRM|nr:RluA family pseudouridine synthase [Merdimonas faecis]HJH50501.1 RluA family pseudouridine synthase [Merdimonas faecis]
MNRTISYDIDSHSEGLRVEQFLRRKGYSAQNLSTIKRMPESILVNGVHYYMKQTLKAGDRLLVRIQETESSRNIPPVCAPLSVVYEDEDLIVINKPAGMPIHPSLNNYTNSLANALAWYYQQQGKPFIFRCCNRLDRDTSGLTVVAKHLVSGNILSTMTKKKEVRREYLAVVRGHIVPESGTISAPLARKGGTIIERVVDFDRGEPAVTHYHLIQEANGHSLVALQLETGRTHQIRIHLKHLGFPLVGDYLYNPDMEYISRQALHSFRLSFPHPITGEAMDFTAPLPEDMRNILTERSSLR